MQQQQQHMIPDRRQEIYDSIDPMTGLPQLDNWQEDVLPEFFEWIKQFQFGKGIGSIKYLPLENLHAIYMNLVIMRTSPMSIEEREQQKKRWIARGKIDANADPASIYSVDYYEKLNSEAVIERRKNTYASELATLRTLVDIFNGSSAAVDNLQFPIALANAATATGVGL